MASEKNHVPDVALNNRRARWGRRGVIASLLLGTGTLAAKSFSWLQFSPTDGGEDYQVIAQWQVPTGGKGLIIAISPGSTLEELRALGKRVQERFHGVDNVAVMIFDDANAARKVRRGSRIISETEFQAALVHQRAMYLKSSARDEDSFTIYDSYPNISEVIRFGNEVLPEPAK
jgi:hypothetical protein